MLKLSPDEPWRPVLRSRSLAERRYQAKEALSAHIRSHFPNRRSAAFLSGILTGEFDDRLMLHEFGRFGLQHIMAISGFHFAIVAAIFTFLMRLFLEKRAAAFILIGLLTLYFIFLGYNPSIIRAYVAVTIMLIGSLWERQGTGLNSLGFALMLLLLYDPLLCLHIGFQYSFAATGAILLFFSPLETLLQKWFPKRFLGHLMETGWLNQHGYLLLSLLRQGMALGIAVNLVTVPMMLYHFHRFPWMSLLYNLFFPAMVSVSMLLLILGLISPFLSGVLHGLNGVYTSFMLDLTYTIPPALDLVLRVESFPIEVLAIYLTLLLHRVKKFST